MGLLIRLMLCIAVTVLFAYLIVHKQNSLTELRMEIPKIAQQIETIKQKNQRLKYIIDSFENPIHLMELARKPEFAYLKHPYTKDIIFLELPPEEESKDETFQ